MNYWRASGASCLIRLIDGKPRKMSHRIQDTDTSTGNLLLSGGHNHLNSGGAATSSGQRNIGKNSGYDSDDLDDEEKLLEALIRSEMGDDAV